jgi:hypothetical protein
MSWVRSQHPPTQWNLRGADEAVLNIVHKKEKKAKKSPFKELSTNPPAPLHQLTWVRGQITADPLACAWLYLSRCKALLFPNLSMREKGEKKGRKQL